MKILYIIGIFIAAVFVIVLALHVILWRTKKSGKKLRSKALTKFANLTLGVKTFFVFFFFFFLIESLICIFPFLFVINNSLKTMSDYQNAILNYQTFSIPVEFYFGNFLNVFKTGWGPAGVGYVTMLWNSVWESGVFLFINVLSSFFVAYAISKFRFPGKGIVYGLMIFTQTIPIVGTGVASFKLRYALGMINNPWTIWFYWAMGFDYSAFVLLGAFNGVSKSYSESAEIDGASEFQIMAKIILPQVMPVLVALLITNFVGRWNDYTTSQVSLDKYPNLAYGLLISKAQIMRPEGGSEFGEPFYYSALVLTALPGVILYASFQNLIIKNISIGGIKG